MAPEEPPPDLPPEVVGTSGAVQLRGATGGRPDARSAPCPARFRTARGGDSEPQRVFLTVEDITGEVNPGISYGVYVGDAADDSTSGRAGLVLRDRGQPRREGSPLGYAFDVTDIVQALRDEGSWDPADVHVIFEPIGPVHDDGRSVEPGHRPDRGRQHQHRLPMTTPPG